MSNVKTRLCIVDKNKKSLAQKLKKICDKNGKELNQETSAPVLHELGKTFPEKGQNGSERFSMTLSAAIYSAVIVRSSKNDDLQQKMQKDLLSLCRLILQETGAKIQSADFAEQSNTVKLAIEDMRNKVYEEVLTMVSVPGSVFKDELHGLKKQKIRSMKNLQAQIFKDYSQVMAELTAYCHSVMGNSPCRFALVRMGSLARKEITPYSDFKNIIILENAYGDDLTELEQEAILEYFRWFAVIFQTVLINLKETTLPSIAIPYLNDFYFRNENENWFYDAVTPRGVSYDGMMRKASKSLLGRWQHTANKPWETELIKPIDKILKLLSKSESLKNGYKLDDILTKTCFVYGYETVYDEFKTGVIKVQEQEK